MRVISIRHGESERNLERVIQEQVSGKLTAKGKTQSKRLAKRLSNEIFDMIYCSDAERAKETVVEIKKFYPDVSIEYTEQLREMNAGEYVGASWKEYGRTREESKDGFARFKPRGGESIIEMVRRVNNFLTNLYGRHEGQQILLVTHGGVNKAIKHLAERGSSEPVKEEGYEQNNCCVNVAEYDGNSLKLRLYNCTKHLR